MKKFFKKAQSALNHEHQAESSVQPATTPEAPSLSDVYRYRYHHGTNLGSVFVLERWLYGSMFPDSSEGESEIAAVTASVAAIGMQATKEKWQKHWTNALTDADLKWLCLEARCTSIRLPIGYFTLGKEFSANTPYESIAEIYEQAWQAVKDLISRAAEWGIGVLIDLHSHPGGANKDAHSGCDTGKAEFWKNKGFRERGKKCIAFVAQQVSNMPSVIGIQLVNEAASDAERMWDWYEDVISEIAKIDDTIPLYVSDGWDVDKASQWLTNFRGSGKHTKKNPVIIDTHKYYTFSEEHRNLTPAQILDRVVEEGRKLHGQCVVVGEYSCVLDGRTWQRCDDSEKENYVRRFGQAQSHEWQTSTGGSYFWTLKMEWMDGGEWGFIEQSRKSNITAPAYMSKSHVHAKGFAHEAQLRKEDFAKKARYAHDAYWQREAPGQKMEHERYSEGWSLGWDDAMTFYIMRSDGAFGNNVVDGVDKIGCLEAWIGKRENDTGGQHGSFAWEWRQGLEAGIKDFDRFVDRE